MCGGNLKNLVNYALQCWMHPISDKQEGKTKHISPLAFNPRLGKCQSPADVGRFSFERRRSRRDAGRPNRYNGLLVRAAFVPFPSYTHT